MKKIAVLIALGTITLTSCKKEYVCTCVDAAGEKSEYTISTTDKNEAKSACDGYSATYGEDCSL